MESTIVIIKYFYANAGARDQRNEHSLLQLIETVNLSLKTHVHLHNIIALNY